MAAILQCDRILAVPPTLFQYQRVKTAGLLDLSDAQMPNFQMLRPQQQLINTA